MKANSVYRFFTSTVSREVAHKMAIMMSRRNGYPDDWGECVGIVRSWAHDLYLSGFAAVGPPAQAPCNATDLNDALFSLDPVIGNLIALGLPHGYEVFHITKTKPGLSISGTLYLFERVGFEIAKSPEHMAVELKIMQKGEGLCRKIWKTKLLARDAVRPGTMRLNTSSMDMVGGR